MKFYQIIIFSCLLMQAPRLLAQNPNADTARPNIAYNHFGAWIWKIDYTNLSHAQLADKLKALGVKRVYIKVSDGRHEANKFPELNNKHTVEIYKNRGLEVWAWSYNYPDNEAEQATVLTRAAKTGYAGYVLDLEIEFDARGKFLRWLVAAQRLGLPPQQGIQMT